MESKEIYSRVIWQDEPGFNQVRLVINEFLGKEYLHVRKYYLDFENQWLPTNQGLHIPLEIGSTKELFEGLAEIMSLAESRSVIEEYFGDVITKVYNNS